MKILILLLVLTSCSDFETDCFMSGARITMIHTIFPTYTTSQMDKKEPITLKCELVTDSILPVSIDTIFNQNDTIIIKEVFNRFIQWE